MKKTKEEIAPIGPLCAQLCCRVWEHAESKRVSFKDNFSKVELFHQLHSLFTRFSLRNTWICNKRIKNRACNHHIPIMITDNPENEQLASLLKVASKLVFTTPTGGGDQEDSSVVD
ncbi:hypothetical protein V6N13_113187 [Hibiscus sabdariffa]|uniref:Uncharacterized protein n=1 Tax=Hibiscus sabdariffa TaxID=183260 RepID=A0ABR2CTX9_9ROSI